MNIPDEWEEAVARIICKMVDDIEPDSNSFPMHADPKKNLPYPAWHDYRWPARNVIMTIAPAIAKAEREECANLFDTGAVVFDPGSIIRARGEQGDE